MMRRITLPVLIALGACLAFFSSALADTPTPTVTLTPSPTGTRCVTVTPFPTAIVFPTFDFSTPTPAPPTVTGTPPTPTETPPPTGTATATPGAATPTPAPWGKTALLSWEVRAMIYSQTECEIQDATGTHLWVVTNYEYVYWQTWTRTLNLPAAVRCQTTGDTHTGYWDYHWVKYSLSSIQFEPDTCAYVNYDGNSWVYSTGYFPRSGTFTRCYGEVDFIPHLGFDADSAHGISRTVGGLWELELGREWDDGSVDPPPPDLPICSADFELPCTDDVCFGLPTPQPTVCYILWPNLYAGMGWANSAIQVIWPAAPAVPDIDIPGIELCVERLTPNLRLWDWDAVDILAIFGGLLLIALISREIRS